MLTKEQIIRFEKIYTQNIDKAIYWEHELTQQYGHDDWMKVIHNRSKALRDIYLENQNQIDILFHQLDEDMTDDVIEELYSALLRMYYSDRYDDAVIMTRIADALLPYYQKEEDILHILNLLSVKAVLTTEYFYRQSQYPKEYTYQTIHGKIYDYRHLYDQLQADERRIIMSNFYNMICVLPMILCHELNQYLDIYDEFQKMMNNETYRALDSQEPLILYRQETVHTEIWNMAEVIEYFDQEHLLHFYELIQEAYHKYKKSTHQIEQQNLISAYYYTSAYIHEQQNIDTEIDWMQAYDYLRLRANELLKALEDMDIQTFDDEFLIPYYYPYQETSNYMFKVYRQIKDQVDSSFIKDFIHRGSRIFNKIPKDKKTWLIYAIHTEWCENAIGALDDANEQLLLLNEIVVKGQIQTYIHSQMVGLLAYTILDKIIQIKPKLLLSLPYFDSIETIKKHRKEFLMFVDQAALLHDIGKNKISSVINQQMRKLSDSEFCLIKQHPEHPESGILKYTQNFKQYYDIILGHHKSYDGKSGYPSDFDNVHSPNRILIDVITICDSIDAATDFLGRNYVGGTDMEGVLKELDRDKGTRYNPDIVNLIMDNKELQKELLYIVENRRDEVYYQTYKEYFV